MSRERGGSAAQDWIPGWLVSKGGGWVVLVAAAACLAGMVGSTGLAVANQLDGRAASSGDLAPLLVGNASGLAWTAVCLAYLAAARLLAWFSPRS